MVVLPVPGGPHSSSAVGWSASTSRRSGEPSASRWSCPTSSSRVAAASARRAGRAVAAVGQAAARPGAWSRTERRRTARRRSPGHSRRSLRRRVGRDLSVSRWRDCRRARIPSARGSRLRPWRSPGSARRSGRPPRGHRSAAAAAPAAAQMSCAFQHRVRNRQPDGGLIGLGTSPSSRIRSRRPPIAACFTSGAADSSACV